MRQLITTALVVGALAAVPLVGFAATPRAAQKPTAQHASAPKQAAAIHATSGVVKSMDANTLVITRQGKKQEMTFSLNTSTRREGTIALGSPVSVRYQKEGNKDVATAISLRNAQAKETHPRASAAK